MDRKSKMVWSHEEKKKKKMSTTRKTTITPTTTTINLGNREREQDTTGRIINQVTICLFCRIKVKNTDLLYKMFV